MCLKKIIHNNHFQSAISQLSSALISFGTFIFLARVMAKVELGNWVIYLTALTFVDMIKAGVVQTALIKYSSGASDTFRKQMLGSSWVLNIVGVSIFTFIVWPLYYLEIFQSESVSLFFKYYPLYSFFSMPFKYYLWNAQINFEFSKITIVLTLNAFLFFISSLIAWMVGLSTELLIVCHCLVFFVISVYCILSKGAGIENLKYANKATVNKIISFGKYHALAFLGSNLLRSSDVFIVSFFGGAGLVAIYSIPLRLVEIIEMPLKSAVKVAFPTFSKFHNNSDLEKLKCSVESYIGVLSFLYIPFMVLLFVFSGFLIELVGGGAYDNSLLVFQIFLVFGLFLPFDRITGITLDAIGKPKFNFYKVLIMASVNIIGDFIVMYFFQSLELVAVVTVVNVIAGLLVGFFLLRKYLNISLKGVFENGIKTLKYYYNQLINMLLNPKKKQSYESTKSEI